ncbi:MAG: type VI secretion system tip protein TssI/VgrG [Byssovorax sp.]
MDLALLCATPDVDASAAVGTPAALRLVDEIEGTSRDMGFVVTSLAYAGEGRDGSHYDLALGPPEGLLAHRAGNRIFLDKTTREIFTQVLGDAGITADQIVFRLSGAYEKRLTCTQYRETEWAFLGRLLAEEGISYWFEMQGEDKPVLIVADDKGAYEGITDPILVPYEDPMGTVPYRHFFDLAFTESVTVTKVAVRDYDVRAPEVPLDGEAGEGALEHFEYPINVLTSDAAKARAQVRLEQLQQRRLLGEGRSDCVRLQPGRVVQLDRCADEWMNARYLITRVEHDISEPAPNDAAARTYQNRVSLVPHGEVAFRPDLPASPPRVTGLEPAVTTGPGGEEIHVDDLGRVKIRFPWDRSGLMDDTSSAWVRCLQMGMEGSMILPRVGWEVPVVYLDGNPDRPFVLGRAYNATAVVPYGLPAGAATTTLQSATSPGGGSTNEIRMVDDGGKQEMFVHATKDQTVSVGGSATTTVSANETHDVGLTLKTTVNASQTLTVGASQSVNVGTDYATSVSGSRTEMIGGMEAIKVTANRFVVVGGAYTELIGGLYGIQCNQSNTGCSAAFTQLVGGSYNLVGGLGVAETVLAARTELVGGSKSLVSLGGASDSVTGAKSITSGPVNEKAGGGIGTGTAAAGSIKVGATAKLTAGGPIVLEAPNITIEAASIKTNEVTISGGKVTVKKGTTKVKGTIKRQGGAHLDSG